MDLIRTSKFAKGFAITSDDTDVPVSCRDLRGFPALLVAAAAHQRQVDLRVSVVVPDVAMDDWLARWARDDRHPERLVMVKRRTDRSKVRMWVTIATHGFGVDTVLAVSRVELAQATVPPPVSERISGTIAIPASVRRSRVG